MQASGRPLGTYNLIGTPQIVPPTWTYAPQLWVWATYDLIGNPQHIVPPKLNLRSPTLGLSYIQFDRHPQQIVSPTWTVPKFGFEVTYNMEGTLHQIVPPSPHNLDCLWAWYCGFEVAYNLKGTPQQIIPPGLGFTPWTLKNTIDKDHGHCGLQTCPEYCFWGTRWWAFGKSIRTSWLW